MWRDEKTPGSGWWKWLDEPATLSPSVLVIFVNAGGALRGRLRSYQLSEHRACGVGQCDMKRSGWFGAS